MAFIVRESGKSVVKSFANAEQKVFLEERKARVLRKECLYRSSRIEEQKQELKGIVVENTIR